MIWSGWLEKKYPKDGKLTYKKIRILVKISRRNPALVAWSEENLLHKKCHLLAVDRIPLGEGIYMVILTGIHPLYITFQGCVLKSRKNVYNDQKGH